MKAIILGAGYATRLYPLTKDKPKPLLEVKGKPIIEHIIAKIAEIELVDEVLIVTNDKFFRHFLEWNSSFSSSKKITIVNDRTTSNEDRLGSLGDIRYVLENMHIGDDIMVIAGDNLFEFSLNPLIDLYSEKKGPIVALYDVGDPELAKLYGIVSIDSDSKIIDFQEKPDKPRSTLSSTGIYVYPKDTAEKLVSFTKDHDADKAGSFLEWLYKKQDIFCCVTQENWFDIGSLEQLEKARKEFSPQ
jgi:glucose-1-phosphate thymidylyltransferase